MSKKPQQEPMPRLVIALPTPLREAISDYRFAERIPTEAEAIRRLIQAGLEAEANAKTKKEKKP